MRSARTDEVSRQPDAPVDSSSSGIGSYLASALWAARYRTRGSPRPAEAAAFQALDRYLVGARSRRPAGETAVPFRIDAELPKLHKRGALKGLKVITEAGRTVYTQLHFVGDNLVRPP